MTTSSLKPRWPLWLAAIGVSAGMGMFMYRRLYNRTIPNRILTMMKGSFVNRGTIENSWITMHPVTLATAAGPVRVYTGGLTIRQNANQLQFAFAVEPDGTLQQLKQLHAPTF